MIASVRALFLGAVIASGLTLPTQAQEPAAKPRRWYVGAGAGSHYYSHIFFDQYGAVIRPAYAYAGVRLVPRWSVQLGVQARQQTEQFSNDTERNGVPISYRTTERRRDVALPLLLRYTLNKKPHDLEAEWLLGVTWLGRSFRDERTETQPSQQRTSVNAIRRWGGQFSTGLGLRYAPGGGRVFADASLLLHKDLRYPPFSFYGYGAGANAGLGFVFGKPSKMQ